MYYGARGIVGLVKPTYRPGSMESFIKLLPEGSALFRLMPAFVPGMNRSYKRP
jgi:hypothetical protein